MGSTGISIQQASEQTGIEIHTLRYWETEFPTFLRPLRTEGGQRRYRDQDIEAVLTLKRLLRDEMFSLAGAKRHLNQLCKQSA